ncbi:MAG: formimidoylglutamate deiminase, partial [Sphingomonadales bacterium]
RAIAGENPGATLWQGALGAAAMGNALGGIQVGARANIVVLDENSPAINRRQGDAALDALVFAGQPNPVRNVMVGGKWQVKDGHYSGEDAIQAAYLSTLNKL